jgi:hypothetical protein
LIENGKQGEREWRKGNRKGEERLMEVIKNKTTGF